MELEKKLQNYRATKRRKELFTEYKAKFLKMILPPRITGETTVLISDKDSGHTPDPVTSAIQPNTTDSHPVVEEVFYDSSDSESEHIDTTPTPHYNYTYFDYVKYAVYFLFWITCFAIAIELQFGTVYFMFSMLFGVYFNTRTTRKKNEVSAYSVFNENCHSIDGTLKAEQFEREIRYGVLR